MSYSDIMESATHSHESSIEGQTNLTIEDVYHILSNSRRRQVISLLDGQGQRADVGDLATQMALLLEGSRDDEPDGQVRKRIYVSLVQCHLPKMADHGIIEYDHDRKEVQPTPLLSEVAERDSLARAGLLDLAKLKIRNWLLA